MTVPGLLRCKKCGANMDEYPPEAIAEATVRYNQMSESEKREVVAPALAVLDALRPSFMDIMKSSFGLFDLLWFALAMGTAFKVGNGGDD